MTFQPVLLVAFLWLAPLLLPLPLSAQHNAAPASESAESEDDARGTETSAEQAAETDGEPVEEVGTLPFDPADIGLPGLPQPMRSADDFKATLELIDARLAELEAALDRAEPTAAEANAAAEAETLASPGIDVATETPADAATDVEAEDDTEPDQDAAAANTFEATAARYAGRIEVLRELRIAVQRRATLHERLTAIEGDVATRREQLETIEQEGVDLEPPFLISQLDQQQAELALKQAVEEMAETRLRTATRRLSAAERELTNAVRARRAVRDGLTAANDEGLSAAEREALEHDLELARLNELLARQRLAAAENALAIARNEDRLAETQQALLGARIAFLEARAELPREALDQRLAELTTAEEEIYAQIEVLQSNGDQAESALYRAQRRLADAGDDADQAALSEWVAAHRAELDAARASVDMLSSAMDNLSRMRALWELRYQLMSDPESLDLAVLLRQTITDAATARAEKDAIEARLNALRAIQLAQARRLRDPALSEDAREALAVRSAAHDVAERRGRELLETQDALIALLQGMRHQLDNLLQEPNLSLQLLQAQETLASWWNAELIVIDDQSVRVRDLVTALAMFVVVLIAVSLIRIGAGRALKRRRVKSPNADYGDLRLALSAISGNTSQLFVLIVAFYVAMTVSGLASPTVKNWLWNALVVAFYAQLGIWANAAMVDYFNRRRTRQEMRDPSTVTGYGLLTFFLRVGIWITVVVSLLAYFKYPVAGLVGALGVGSLAIAFAVQNILGDVFSSMAIILDKPFRVGDFVKAGETLGVIENIGVKTTRIRSLSGEQVVLSNTDLLNSRIHNFKHFKERRVVFRLGVVYQTPRDLLERIPDMIREAVEEQPHARFDRAHFFEFGDFALTFEVVYFVLSPDFAVYMNAQQGINLGIHRRFEAAGISFAYPTQELILRRGPGQMVVGEAAAAAT
jgi:small-conductance mechanosensitive channel